MSSPSFTIMHKLQDILGAFPGGHKICANTQEVLEHRGGLFVDQASLSIVEI